MCFWICTDVRVREGEPSFGLDKSVQGLKSQVQGLVPEDSSIAINFQQLMVQQCFPQRFLQLRPFLGKQREGSQSSIHTETLLYVLQM